MWLFLGTNFGERASLLKKSLSDQSVVRNTQEPRPKHYKTVDLNSSIGVRKGRAGVFQQAGALCELLRTPLRRTSPKRSSKKFALRVGLLLDHRLCWLRGGYGVRVPMHNLPLTIFFRSKVHRSPHS